MYHKFIQSSVKRLLIRVKSYLFSKPEGLQEKSPKPNLEVKRGHQTQDQQKKSPKPNLKVEKCQITVVEIMKNPDDWRKAEKQIFLRAVFIQRVVPIIYSDPAIEKYELLGVIYTDKMRAKKNEHIFQKIVAGCVEIDYFDDR